MNVNFKPLGIAAAVAAASAGYAGAINAQEVAAETELGDLAIVPYYTVLDGFSTGVNIINTSAQTQVLKFRFRRAVDSMDALDFNVVLSPNDMYTGFIGLEASGDITWTSNDNSCTAPAYNTGANKFTMPAIYRVGAETGYVEIISMGSPDSETAPIALAARHDSTGVPANCDDVRDNFFANVSATGVADLTTRGVIDSDTTHQFTTTLTGPVLQPTNYVASPDSLKVSYFIKSDETGVEFGDNATHIAGFMTGPAMTNQQRGIFSGDLQGFDHPDLNGGAPLDPVTGATGTPRGQYNVLRDILASTALINDWSKNSTGDFSVDTDWVVTFPGQYVMLNLPIYLTEGPAACLRETAALAANAANPTSPIGDVVPCDYRDIPVTASFSVYDREEQGIVVEEGDLVVSPQPPQILDPKALDQEVNVIQWGDNSVLNAPINVSVDTPAGSRFGWASLSTVPADANLAICDFTLNPALPYDCALPATGGTPVVGFAAWQRAFVTNPGSNYGRIVEHSRVQSSAPATP